MPRISKLKSEEAAASPVRRSTRLHSQTENNVENKLETPNEEASTTNDPGSSKKIRTRRTSNSAENKPTPTPTGRKTSTSSDDLQVQAVPQTRTRSASREGTPIKTAAARATTSREGTPVKAVKLTDNKPMRITRQRRSASVDQETEVIQRVTRSRRNSADVEVAALPQSEPVALEISPKSDQTNLNLSIIQENSFNEAEEEKNQTNKSTSPNSKVDEVKNQSSNDVKNQLRIVVDKLDVSLSPRRSPRLIKCSGKSPCYKKCNCDGTETVSSSSVNVASELNDSKSSIGSDKENVSQNLKERSLSNSPVSDKSVLRVVPIETTARRMTNVFTPKGVRYSFNEPMDVDVTLNTPKFNKSLCEDNLSEDESIHLELPEKEQTSIISSEEFDINAKEVIELINKSLNSSKELDAGQQPIEVSNNTKQVEEILTPINSDIKSSVTDSIADAEQKKEAVEEESETAPINVEAKTNEEDMDEETEIVENESPTRKSIESKSLENSKIESSMIAPTEKAEKLDVECEELISIDDEETDNIQIGETPTTRKSIESKSLENSKIESSVTPANEEEKLDAECEELISIDDEDDDNIQIEQTLSANESIDKKSGKDATCLEEMKSSFIDITVEEISESTDQITEETSDVKIKEPVETVTKSPNEKLKKSVGHNSPVLDLPTSAKLDDFISKKLAEFDQKSTSEESAENSENENSFVDDMAEEGEEDTPSEDSNQIIDEGESIHTESEPESNLDESYSDDSFICKEENFELLSGEEYDLGCSPKEKKKKSRIINVDDRDEDIIVIEKTPKQQQPKKKSRIIPYSGNSSSDDEESPKATESPSRKSTINRAITVLENVNVKDIKDVEIIEKVGNLIKSLSTSLPNEEEVTKMEEISNEESEVQEEAMNVAGSDSKGPSAESEIAAVDSLSKRAKRKRSVGVAAPLKKSMEPTEVSSKGVKRKRSIEIEEIKPVKQLRLSNDQSDKKKSTKRNRNKNKKVGEGDKISKKKTNIPSQSSVGSKHSFGILPQLLTDVKNRPRRLIKPSKTAIPVGWKVEEVQRNFKPSKSIISSRDLADFKKVYHEKDFRSQMLNDASRIKRVSSKVMLRKKGAYN